VLFFLEEAQKSFSDFIAGHWSSPLWILMEYRSSVNSAYAFYRLPAEAAHAFPAAFVCATIQLNHRG
jgi:hypothetical protein